MSATIPMIRAACLTPMLLWMHARGRPVDSRLAAADLDYVTVENPMMPIPLYNAAKFYRDAARAEGPDFGCRVVTETSLTDMALIGKIVLGAQTPREGLARMVLAFPFHCSHEHLQLQQQGDLLRVVEGWSVQFDNETLHTAQQVVASLIALTCSFAEPKMPQLERVEMVPHPEFGLEHLTPWFGRPVVAAPGKTLTVHIASSVADRPYRQIARDRGRQVAALALKPLNSFASLSDSARPVIASMLEAGVPTAERLARAAGLSVRTLQRRLTAEGTSFSLLLEEARRELALKRIAQDSGSLGAVSATVGFARQSALTRAVRRWTGQAPSALRKVAQR